MYENFRVKNYRCFDELTLEPLARVNLIAGKNNVGKTALLEALLLFHEYYNPARVLHVNGHRGFLTVQPKEYLGSLFRDFDPENKISLLAIDADKKEHSLSIAIHEEEVFVQAEGPELDASLGEEDWYESSNRLQRKLDPGPEIEIRFEYRSPDSKPRVHKAFADGHGVRSRSGAIFEAPCPVFLSVNRSVRDPSLAQRLSDLAELKKESSIVEVLSIIEPRLNALKVLQKGRNAMIYGDLGMVRLIPLPLLGDGMVRILSLALGVPPAKDSALLVDEFENGLHYSVVKDVWKAIATAVRGFNVQLFATTHSEECIRSAHEAFSESENYDFRLHRLDYIDNTIKSVTYDQEALEFALTSGWEVR